MMTLNSEMMNKLVCFTKSLKVLHGYFVKTSCFFNYHLFLVGDVRGGLEAYRKAPNKGRKRKARKRGR